MRVRIFAVIAAFVASGCSSPGPLVSNLQKPSSATAFTLTQKYESDIRKLAPTATKPGYFGLFAGNYVAEKENTLGTFYRGAKFSIFYPSAGERYFVRTGGIWVPKNEKEKIMLFCYFNLEWKEVADYQALLAAEPKGTQFSGVNVIVSPYSNAGVVGGAVGSSIVNLMIASENGNYQFIGYIDDQEFSDKIRKTLSVQ